MLWTKLTIVSFYCWKGLCGVWNVMNYFQFSSIKFCLCLFVLFVCCCCFVCFLVCFKYLFTYIGCVGIVVMNSFIQGSVLHWKQIILNLLWNVWYIYIGTNYYYYYYFRLTAFVTKCFVQAVDLIPTIIDSNVIGRSLKFMIGNQAPNGSFPEPGKVFNSRLQVSWHL